MEQRCTSIAYNLSRIKALYYNEYIRMLSTAHNNNPDTRISVSISVLRDKLIWGCYNPPYS